MVRRAAIVTQARPWVTACLAMMLVVACTPDTDGLPPETVDTSTTATTAVTTTATTSTTGTTSTTVAPTTNLSPTTTLPPAAPALLRYGDDGVALVDDGHETQLAGGSIKWAASDRAGGVVFTRFDESGTTWWLPAGAAEPVRVDMDGVPDATADGRPVLVGSSGESEGACEEYEEALVRHDLPSGEESLIACVVRAEGDAWGSMTSSGGGRMVISHFFKTDPLTVTVTGLEIMVPEGEPLDVQVDPCHDVDTESPADGYWMCDVHGMVSSDGRLLATWYRPDYWLAVPTDDPWYSDPHRDLWSARLDTLPAWLAVIDLGRGSPVFSAWIDARTRIADFDGRFIVIAPRELDENDWWADDRDTAWTVLDTTRWESFTVDGPVAIAIGN
jgi:hypothetical protein